MRVTTSWDDGHVQDLRVADLLEKYGLQGTFYVSPASRELAANERLTAEQTQALSQRFEIGGHTLTHPDLTRISLNEAIAEIEEGRITLEGVTGKAVTSFCYPYGKYNRKVTRALRDLGFTYARTVKQFVIKEGNPLAAGTTVHAYTHRSDLLNKLRLARLNPIRAWRYRDWSDFAIDLFERCLRENGIFHLWGHSWEVDKHGDWPKLEKVFAHISGHERADYVPNSALGRPPRPRLLIASSYFPPKMGGLERYAEEMARGAVRAGYDVHVITSGTSGSIETQTTGDGILVHRLPVQFRISDTPLSLRWPAVIRRLVREIDPDIINVHMPVPYLADLTALFSQGAPVIVTYHSGSMKSRGFLLDRVIDIYEKGLLPLALKKAATIICSSESVRGTFLKKYAHKSITITPGVDTTIFRKRTSVPDNRKVIFVGDFRTGLKGLDHLKEAIKLVPDAELHVVGKGPQISSLHTTYHGELFGEELAVQIRGSRMLVLPSINESESFGMVLIEAMACGVPVIGTDIGGISRVIENNVDGLLVPPGDAGALAGAINHILDDPGFAEELADRAYTKVTRCYQWDESIDIFLGEISEILPKQRSGAGPLPQVSRSGSFAR